LYLDEGSFVRLKRFSEDVVRIALARKLLVRLNAKAREARQMIAMQT